MSREAKCDILIVGGGTGGCAAAMAACSLGYRVIMTEETDWVGGQLTSQAVPPDEHPWIESHGCTRRYRVFRNQVRQYYRDFYPLNEHAMRDPLMNPGNGWVSRLCFEPKVGVAVLNQMLAKYRATGLLEVWLNTVAIGAEVQGDEVKSVTVRDLYEGDEFIVSASYVLDATELGDLLPMTGTEYWVGSEGQDVYGEMHAPAESNPEDIQGFTWCMSLGFDPDGEHRIEKPAQYDYWRDHNPTMNPPWPGKLFNWTVVDAITMVPRKFGLFGDLGLFSYRRIIDGSMFTGEVRANDISIINWVQNDHFDRVIDVPADRAELVLDNARQQSLSLLFWLQNDAERDEGGYGYPELYLAGEPVGTRDGLAMAPYHRESRRIKAEFTVTEHHVGVLMREGHGGSEKFDDSVGIGAYRMDLHPSASGRNSVDLASYPFQIPLGALVPIRVENLMPACKNLGVSHITNGCYRLHPVEWNIGEAAGLLAGYCLQHGLTPKAVSSDFGRVKDFQNLCLVQGFELDWPTTRAL